MPQTWYSRFNVQCSFVCWELNRFRDLISKFAIVSLRRCRWVCAMPKLVNSKSHRIEQKGRNGVGAKKSMCEMSQKNRKIFANARRQQPKAPMRTHTSLENATELLSMRTTAQLGWITSSKMPTVLYVKWIERGKMHTKCTWRTRFGEEPLLIDVSIPLCCGRKFNVLCWMNFACVSLIPRNLSSTISRKFRRSIAFHFFLSTCWPIAFN